MHNAPTGNHTIFRLILLAGLFALVVPEVCAQHPESLLLRDYRPRSIYRIPITPIPKAKFPVLDVHAHQYPETTAGLDEWVKLLDKYGIEKTVILTDETGARFDSLVRVYSKYADRFQLWCGLDLSSYPSPGWADKTIRELERCRKAGARGVGEITDKGVGLWNTYPERLTGLHLDDPALQPVLRRLGELDMPINVHVAEPMWMYEKMDSTNDGLMNAYTWRIPRKGAPSERADRLGHAALIGTLESIVKNNPKTTFIACHLANCEYDLSILGDLLTRYPNLYADVAARFAETAPIPRYMNAFITKHQDRILYGSDMSPDPFMYETTFRILQTADEHFYATDLTGYHWPLHGFGLPDDVLKKVYHGNARKIIR
jgi:predicted TIM-barrel fold metal-dependent hydrolase